MVFFSGSLIHARPYRYGFFSFYRWEVSSFIQNIKLKILVSDFIPSLHRMQTWVIHNLNAWLLHIMLYTATYCVLQFFLIFIFYSFYILKNGIKWKLENETFFTVWNFYCLFFLILKLLPNSELCRNYLYWIL